MKKTPYASVKFVRVSPEHHEQLKLIASYQRRSIRVCLEVMIEQKLASLNEGKETK
jgi:predicted HicB family RNase H-like nuclease